MEQRAPRSWRFTPDRSLNCFDKELFRVAMKLLIVKSEIVFCLTLIRYDTNDFFIRLYEGL